ncbi:unnamed protein product [Rotaria sp. Silwood1]|nr:unnamed protein product [Rotaria sp. Silwood1]
MPSIEEEVMKRVERPLQDALLSNPIVEKMLRLDGYNRSNYYENLIKRKAMELLNPHNEPEHALLIISKGIAMGIASNKIPGLFTISKVSEAVTALNKLESFLPKFIESLNKEIDQISRMENVSKKIEDLDKQQQSDTQRQVSTQQCEIEKDIHRISTSSYIQEYQREDINLELAENQEEQVTLEKGIKSSKELQQHLARSVSVNMCNIIKSKLITPVTNATINFGMKKITAGLNKSIQGEIGNYQAERRIEFFQDKNLYKRIPDEFKTGDKDQKALEKVDQIFEELEKGGEAGLHHLGPLCDAIGRPIKVLDEHGNVKYIIGEDKGGTPVEAEHHKSKRDDLSSHWTLRGNKEPMINNSGKNNCLLNVIAQQTGKDPEQLREYVASRMKNNKPYIANQARDIERLEQYKKDALIMGGAKYVGTSAIDAGKILDDSQGKQGQNDPNKYPRGDGHARGHASDPSKRTTPPGKNCIEDYSCYPPKGEKTGFNSYAEQNEAVHHGLSDPDAQTAMQRLNNGSYREIVEIVVNNKPNLGNIASTFKMGVKQGSNYTPSKIKLVLEHQAGQYSNRKADVHVVTAYPIP